MEERTSHNELGLSQRGDRIAGTARKLEHLDNFNAQYSDRLWIRSLVLTDTPAIREAVNAAFAHFGRIDIVMSNAGYALFGAAEEVTHDRKRPDKHFRAEQAILGVAMPEYANTQAGRIRETIKGGAYIPPGDPAKMVRAMIDSVDQVEASKRLALGSDAYSLIRRRSETVWQPSRRR